MSRKAPSKKSTTHKRKKHAIDHEWLMKAFEKDHLANGKSIASIAKRYVKVKKSSTVGSISGVLYALKKKHKEERAEVAEAIVAEAHAAVADPPYVANDSGAKDRFFKPDLYDPKARKEHKISYGESDRPYHYTYNVDSPTVKSLQDKADYHLKQYRDALKKILEVIGGEQ